MSDFAPEAENETRKKEAEKHAEFEERAEELPEKVADKSKKRATASSSDSASEKEFARQGSFKRPAMLSAHDAGARDPAEEWNSPVASAPKVELWTDAGVAVSRLASPFTTRRTEIAAAEIVLDRPPMTLRELPLASQHCCNVRSYIHRRSTSLFSSHVFQNVGAYNSWVIPACMPFKLKIWLQSSFCLLL